jgi:uncharacterized protein YjbI with pentapeptide repeats
MKCKHARCDNISLSLAEYCWEHLPHKEAYVSDIVAAINRGDDLSGYNLQKISLKGVLLEKAKLSGIHLCQADLSECRIFDSDLSGADLVGTRAFNAELAHCSLKGADLARAEIVNSRLWNADLTGSNLSECDLSGSDLWNAKLYNTKLWHTSFTGTRSLSKASFNSPSRFFENPRINETGFLSAEESYRDLKRYFIINAMHNDASWASFKEKTMERLIMKKKGDLNYFPSLLMSVLCGYGEKPYRIVLSAVTAILLYACAYLLLGAVQNSAVPAYIVKWTDCLYYSAITFTTVGYGDFIPKPFLLFRLLAAAEAFSGVYLSGLFIFTLARKYSAR